MSETRIILDVIADIGDADAKLRTLQTRFMAFGATTEEIIRKQGAWAGGRFIEKQTAALEAGITKQITLLEKLEVEFNKVTAAAERAATAVTMQRQAAPPITKFLVDAQGLALVDRPIKSAAASWNTLKTSLLAAADADPSARMGRHVQSLNNMAVEGVKARQALAGTEAIYGGEAQTRLTRVVEGPDPAASAAIRAQMEGTAAARKLELDYTTALLEAEQEIALLRRVDPAQAATAQSRLRPLAMAKQTGLEQADVSAIQAMTVGMRDYQAAVVAATEAQTTLHDTIMAEAAAEHAARKRYTLETLAGQEEVKRLGEEAEQLKQTARQGLANDAALARAQAEATKGQRELGMAGYQQLPFMTRARMWLGGADEAEKAAAGLKLYSNAATEVQSRIAGAAAGVHNMSGALAAHGRDMHSATSGAQGFGFALKELVIESGEFARNARGQEISTFLAAMRRIGVGGAAMRIGVPLAGMFAAFDVVRLVKEYSQLAEKTENAASVAGMSAEKYSRLQRTLQLLDIDTQKTANAMGVLAQSAQTALAEPLGQKATAAAAIFGEDYLNKMKDYTEEPIAHIDDLRGAFARLQAQVGQTQAMERFRALMGRQAWADFAPMITASEEKIRKLNSAVDESHLPFTQDELDRLEKFALASKKLGEDFAYLGKSVALLAANTGFIEWLDKVVLNLGALARNAEAAKTALGFITTGAAGGAVLGGVAAGPLWPVGALVGGAIGAVGGGIAGAKVQNARQEAEAERLKQEAERIKQEGGVVPKPGPQTPSEASTRGPLEQRGEGIITPPSGEMQRRYPELYGATPAVDPNVLISEAAKYREEIEQTSRLVNAQLQVRKAEAELTSKTEAEKQSRIKAIENEEQANRARAVADEQHMLELYKERGRSLPTGIRPAFERELYTRVGKQIEVEQQDTARQGLEVQKRLAEEDYRIFAENGRAKIAAAKGNLEEIAQIYQSMLAKARTLPGGGEREQQEIARSYIDALEQAQGKAFAQTTEFNSAAERLDKIKEAQEKARLQTQVYAHALSKESMYQQEAAFTSKLMAEEESRVEAELRTTNLTSDQRERLYDHLAELYEKDAENQIQVQEKITQAIEKENEKRTKAFKDLFDTLGSGLEKAVSGFLSGEHEQNMLQNLRKSIVGSVTKGIFELGSQFAGKKVGDLLGVKTEGMTDTSLGSVLARWAGDLLGLTKKTPEEEMKGVQEKLAKAADAQQKAAELFKDSGSTLEKAGQALLEAAKQIKDAIGGFKPSVPAGPAGPLATGKSPTAAESTEAQTKAWQEAHLATVGVGNVSVQVNKEIADHVQSLLNKLTAEGYQIHSLSGFRPGATVEGTGRPSRHATGMAIDINPRENPRGATGNLPPDMAAIVASESGRWGKGFGDPMHVDWGETATQVSALSTAASKAAANLNSIKPPTQLHPDVAPAMASGGPVGTDTTLAWLTPGERVLNLAETQAYHRKFPSGILRYQGGGLIAGVYGGSYPTIPGEAERILHETPEEAAAAVQRTLAGRDRTWKEMMEAMPVRGFAGRGEDIPMPRTPSRGLAQRLIENVGGLPGDIYHAFGDVFGKRMQMSVEEMGSKAYKRPLPVIGYGYGYQHGGMVGPGLTSVTSESRGFTTPHLVQAFPGMGKGWGLMLGILGAAAGLAGLAVLIGKSKDEEELAKKLLDAKETSGEKDVTQTTTPLASDEVAAVLQRGERVLPKYHTGGVVGFQGGGVTPDTSSPTYSPPSAGGGSSAVIKDLATNASSLSSGLSALVTDVSKMSQALTGLGRTTQGTESATNKLTSGLSSISGAFGGLKSLLGMFTGGGGGGGGGDGGGFLGGIGTILGAATKILPLFFLKEGGIIPSAQGGMIVPSMQRGGTLAMLHPNEMVLPSHIANAVQGMAANQNQPDSPDIHFHLHTIDQRSGAQFLMTHRDTIAGMYRSSVRNFNPNVRW